MNSETDFSDKWQDFLKTVRYAIMLDIKNKKKVNESELNKIIRVETLSWLNQNVSKGVFLQTLKKKNPQLGNKFEQVLNNLHCTDGISIKSISTFFVTALIFVIAVLIFGLLHWILAYDIKLSAGVAFLLMVIGAPLGSKIANDWNQKNISQKVDQIIQDLNQQGNALRQIVREVE